MQFTAADWTSFLTGEILAASVLGKTLYTYPETAWLQALIDEDVFSESPLGGAQPDVQRGLSRLQTWTQQQNGSLSPAALDDLRADYTRLLLGTSVVLAPPWESVYFSDERLIFQEQTVQVRAWYRRFGLEAPHHAQEPDDHIGLELLFVAQLARQALVALEEQDQAAFEELLAAQRSFLTEHLFQWAAQWCDLVETQANTLFFQGLAPLTKGILAEIGQAFHVQRLPSVAL